MLADAVQGSLRPSQEITWTRADGTAEDLTGATLTGRIRDEASGAVRAIAGGLTVVNAASGVFRWDYNPGDVISPGLFAVQFSAAFSASPTPAVTFFATWQVLDAI